ncbi:class I SAM-dependent methyltransferase [Dinghuibacter silviterrae]|uniref:Methyltransferase family protein n=1 Tax=Dinghuibacter silviterrae TaxID=1539049 RepID=A0A4R8DFU5_9BACT|nr:class I SAM-dependent methyltransferase [Dinghuibacter silviterrae]TDW96481.1 methyltransferase family protein [Dinghuibacter silviterrae]
MIHYDRCPVCGASTIHPALEAKDYTVSGQTFAIWHCDGCTVRFTQDVPGIEDIGPYYQSDAYISHSDTREGLVNSLYHKVRAYTLQSKRKLVERASGKKAGDLLDIGCGTGAFLHTMQTAGWTVKGLEPDAGAREKAASLYGLTVQPVHELFDLPPASCDVITLWHVLEHVHDLKAYVDQFRKLLKPGGTLIIAVPNYTSFDADRYGAAWAAYDVPRHLYHFSPASMERLLQPVGLRVTGLQPMWFDSFYVSMLSERYKSGHENLIGAVFTGLRSNGKAWGNTALCSSVIYVCR